MSIGREEQFDLYYDNGVLHYMNADKSMTTVTITDEGIEISLCSQYEDIDDRNMLLTHQAIFAASERQDHASHRSDGQRSCQHLRTDLRERKIKGGTYQIRAQCLDCGDTVGTAVARIAVRGTPKPFDERLFASGRIAHKRTIAVPQFDLIIGGRK